ncbi:MAG: hypothetical protein SangKO_086870 [Sandaracinaceae bacterium]
MSSRRVSDTPLSTRTTRRLAVEADCDPRTISQIMRGESVRGPVADRIRKVLADNGIDAPPVAPLFEHPPVNLRAEERG